MTLQDAGFQQGFEPIRVKFKPTAKDMQVAEESGMGASPGPSPLYTSVIPLKAGSLVYE